MLRKERKCKHKEYSITTTEGTKVWKTKIGIKNKGNKYKITTNLVLIQVYQ